MTSIDGLDDEGLGRLYGPHKVAFWFDEQEDFRSNNERFWSIRRTLIYSDLWDDYDIVSVPVIPEWFGSLLPLERAYQETGHPCIWCVVLGFPTTSLKAKALKLIESTAPSGLVKVEKEDPEPHQYSLPLVGFIAKQIYFALEPGNPRRYDSWEGYETLGLGDDAVGPLEVAEADLAEKMFLRRLALNVGRRLEPPEHSSDIEGLVEHARELWAANAVAASGAVAGTAMERLLAEALPSSERAWAEGATLGPLIDKVVKHHNVPKEQAQHLHSFRELRNECAHALSDSGSTDGNGQLAARIHRWLDWLEEQSVEAIAGAGPGMIEVPRERPEPAALHAEADAAGWAAAEAHAPLPMRVSGGSEEEGVVADGVCGHALVSISPASEPFAAWLVSEGHATKAGPIVRMPVFWPNQSMERAAAYARAYVDVLHAIDITASYKTRIS